MSLLFVLCIGEKPIYTFLLHWYSFFKNYISPDQCAQWLVCWPEHQGPCFDFPSTACIWFVGCISGPSWVCVGGSQSMSLPHINVSLLSLPPSNSL